MDMGTWSGEKRLTLTGIPPKERRRKRKGDAEGKKRSARYGKLDINDEKEGQTGEEGTEYSLISRDRWVGTPTKREKASQSISRRKKTHVLLERRGSFTKGGKICISREGPPTKGRVLGEGGEAFQWFVDKRCEIEGEIDRPRLFLNGRRGCRESQEGKKRAKKGRN